MKLSLHHTRFKDLFHQRNLFLGLSSILLVITLIQSVALFFKSEHVVLLPPEVHRGFWVEKGAASASYLEEMATFFAHLVLDVSPKSASFQRDILLRYALPETYGPLKVQLNLDAQRLAKENASTSFEATEVKVHTDKSIVELWGDLVTFVGQKHISQTRQGYVLEMHFKDGRLYLKSFKPMAEEMPL